MQHPVRAARPVRPASALPRAVLLCAVAFLAAPALPAAAAPVPDTVVIGVAQEPDALLFSAMQVSGEIQDVLYAYMIRYNDRGQTFPQLVEKLPTIRNGDWQILPGKKMRVTYRFKRGYTWHDGRPVTALDASWTYLMLRNPRSPTLSRFELRKIDHMLVPNPNDPYTLVVQWNEAYPFANLGHQVLPKHVLEAEYLRDPSRLKAHRQASAPVGNGPYRFVEWVRGSHMTLEAYDRFPEGRPRIKRLVFRFILDSTVLQANVIAGQIDVTATTNNFSLDQMVEIERRNPQIAAHYTQGLIWERLNLNLDDEFLRDKRVRQALAHGINREEITARLFQGKQPVAHTWLPPAHPAHHPNVRKYAYDPGRARQLLQEAGFTPGPDGILRSPAGKRLELTIISTAGNAVREQVEQIMQAQLREVGIDLRINNVPASVLIGQIIRRRTYQITMYANFFGPTTLGSFFHSSQIPSEANNFEGGNHMGWRNAENDRLLDQIAEELDETRRIRLLRRQQELVAEDLPVIPLYFRLYLTTAKKALRNVKPGGFSGITWNAPEWGWAQ
jgi:peptide/nickel transport system substrate-binding protein